MEKNESRTLRNVFIVAGILAALALTVVILYRTERRVRRLFWLIEQRVNPKSKPIEVELEDI